MRIPIREELLLASGSEQRAGELPVQKPLKMLLGVCLLWTGGEHFLLFQGQPLMSTRWLFDAALP